MAGTALVLTGAAALGYGSASVLQTEAARAAEGTLRVLGRPAYLAGTCLDLLAWLCSLAALRTLPVFQVQGVLACSLAVTAVLGRVVLGDRLSRPGVLAVGLSALALVALAASAGTQHPVSLDPAHQAALALGVVPVAVAGWLAVRAGKSMAAAALGGLAFGGAALCARAFAVPADPLGEPAATAGSLAGDPLTWALVAFGITGMLLYAAALEHGDPARATAMLWLAEVAVPSVVGVGLLGDSVRPGRGAVAGCAIVLCLTAGWLLARHPDPTPAPVASAEAPVPVREGLR